MDNDINCRDYSFVFIDTMFWFEALRDKNLIVRLEKWLKLMKIQPILHQFLLWELFHSSKTFDFNELWELIENYCFSNYNPLEIIEKEIRIVYSEGKVEKRDILYNSVFKLSNLNKLRYKEEYINNSKYFRIFKENLSAGKEAYVKGLIKYSVKYDNLKMSDFIHLLGKDMDDDSYKELSERILLHVSRNVKMKDDLKYELLNKVKHIVNTRKSQYVFPLLEIVKLMDNGLYDFDEILAMKLREFIFRLNHLDRLSFAFSSGNYLNHQWNNFIFKLGKIDINKFPGYCIESKVSYLIRKSDSKVKVSDTIDFFNLAYVPYCSLYVTDRHIADSVRQVDKIIGKNVITITDFKKMIL